ncbi:CobB/CobQ domain protein glutamine amidotransferase [candidate division TM7 genomosp. GTL1]|nr:CobB/CobQ domain protein glutamine amidotransferase [candidate division TM7 genomosp. GTL1]
MKQNIKKTITIVHLYPKEMNIYGDRGNLLTLTRRLEWHSYTPKVTPYSPGKPFPKEADIVIGGGGQDSGQSKIQDDLLKIGGQLHKLADSGVPMLAICGLYQLFGRFFKTADGDFIKGIEIFKAETHAGPKRLIGNIVITTDFGEIVGYENHSGLTILDDSQHILGAVKRGAGNNGTDHTEGAVYKNAYGSYLHGSLLPKNPVFADALIEAAVIKKYGEFEPQVIDDRFANLARNVAMGRPR